MARAGQRYRDARRGADPDTVTSVTSLPTTGERTVPEAPREAYWFARHDVAYRWLADRVEPGERWLDAGSGEGYGTARLVDAGAEAIGIELDAYAAAHSARRYSPAAFARGNLIALPFPARRFDGVVSLQVIEHMWEVGRFLDELVRVCRRGGSVYVSTPNRPVFSPGLDRGERPTNPFHVEEFDAQQLTEMLHDAGLRDINVLGVHHGPRITEWERVHGSLVTAQIDAVIRDSWSAEVDDVVASVTASDFVISPVIDDAYDLLAYGRVT